MLALGAPRRTICSAAGDRLKTTYEIVLEQQQERVNTSAPADRRLGVSRLGWGYAQEAGRLSTLSWCCPESGRMRICSGDSSSPTTD